MRQNIMAAGACGRGACSPHGTRKQRGKNKGSGTIYTLQRCTLSDLFPPKRPHILIAHSDINLTMK
jgi:hypothetical protein